MMSSYLTFLFTLSCGETYAERVVRQELFFVQVHVSVVDEGISLFNNHTGCVVIDTDVTTEVTQDG